MNKEEISKRISEEYSNGLVDLTNMIEDFIDIFKKDIKSKERSLSIDQCYLIIDYLLLQRGDKL